MPLHESGDDQDQPSPERVLAALAHRDRLNIVMNLFERPSTQTQLVNLLEINAGTMSRHMAALEDIRLITRERSHGPYSLAAPRETFELLHAVAELSVAAAGLRLECSVAWLDRLDSLNDVPDQQQ